MNEYKDIVISFSIAFVLLVLLIVTNIPPVITVTADNSYLSTQATIEVIINEPEF